MRTVGLILPAEEPAALFECPHCGKEYKSDAALARHIKEKHPDAESTSPTTE